MSYLTTSKWLRYRRKWTTTLSLIKIPFKFLFRFSLFFERTSSASHCELFSKFFSLCKNTSEARDFCFATEKSSLWQQRKKKARAEISQSDSFGSWRDGSTRALQFELAPQLFLFPPWLFISQNHTSSYIHCVNPPLCFTNPSDQMLNYFGYFDILVVFSIEYSSC